MGSEILKLEQIAEELSSAFRNDHGVWLCEALQARRKVGCLADDAALLRFARPDQITDNDEASRNTDTGLKWRFRSGGDLVHCADELQTGTHCPFRIILMSLRIAKIDEDAVTHVFSDEALVTANHLGDPAMIRADHFTQVFRIKPRRKRGRTNQITKHHGQLPTLGFGLRLRLRRGGRLLLDCCISGKLPGRAASSAGARAKHRGL
jgi:hypothetical protein